MGSIGVGDGVGVCAGVPSGVGVGEGMTVGAGRGRRGDGVGDAVSVGVGDGLSDGVASGGGVPVGSAGEGEAGLGDGCGFTSLHAVLHAANALLHAAWFAFSGFLQAWYCTSHSF